MRAAPLTLAVVSTALSPPDDEGVRRFAQIFPRYAAAVGAKVVPIIPGGSTMGRVTFLSPDLIRRLRGSGARVIAYVPIQGGSTLSFVRAAALRAGTGARVIVIALQPARRTALGRWVVRALAPDIVLTPSLLLLEELRTLGVPARFLPMGVDHSRFTPVPDDRTREQLRRAYGLPTDGRVVLHVGHLTPGRNLEWMGAVRKQIGATALMVAGTVTGRDAATVRLLEMMDVKLVQRYLTRIEEVYQLADAYVFPVRASHAAIGAPLSVLEAMACNLPVVTTPFGGLPSMFTQGGGLFFADDVVRFVSSTEAALRMPREEVSTRQSVLRYAWPAVFQEILRVAESL